jgi:putative transposase
MTKPTQTRNKETMEFTKLQLKTLIGNHIKRENGLNEVLEMVLNGLMKTERTAALEHLNGNKANGYRPGRVYGHGKLLELRIPRDRNGEFYPKVLALLRSQQQEVDQLVSALYGQGLTQSQVGQVFERLYGRHYSTSQISRMIDWMHVEVEAWNSRTLEAHYPIVFIDAIHIKVRRDTVPNEAFSIVLGVTPQQQREVLALCHFPTESATGWEMMLNELKARGVEHVDLVVAHGLAGLPNAVARIFPEAAFQRCVVHAKRQLLARVRTEDKPQLAADLNEVFATDHRDDSFKQGWKRWQACCDRWKTKYRRFARLHSDSDFQLCFTYLNYDYRMRSMIYTTNWIERLNRDFRRVLRMRSSMTSEDAVITLLGTVAMEKTAFHRKVPKLDYEKRLFKSSDRRTAPG